MSRPGQFSSKYPAVYLSDVVLLFLCVFLQGVAASTLRFLFEGQRIADNQTPKEVSVSPEIHLSVGFLVLY